MTTSTSKRRRLAWGGGGEGEKGLAKGERKGSMGEGPYEKREVLSKENEGCVFFF